MSEANNILPLRPGRGIEITPAKLKAFAPNCDAETFAPALQSAVETFGIDTLDRAAMWLGQMSAESAGFMRLVENLRYSADRLCAVFPSRFPTVASAEFYANSPEALGDRLYGARMGNTQTGDGWRFRGRGCLQLTGRANYEKFGQILGLDLLGNPDLAAEPANAARIAGAFWHDRNLNPLADKGDLRGVTLAINGALIGLGDRATQVQRARAVLAKP